MVYALGKGFQDLVILYTYIYIQVFGRFPLESEK